MGVSNWLQKHGYIVLWSHAQVHCSVVKGLEKFGDAKAVDASYKERSV